MRRRTELPFLDLPTRLKSIPLRSRHADARIRSIELLADEHGLNRPNKKDREFRQNFDGPLDGPCRIPDLDAQDEGWP